ncbi:MAG: ferric reductase-like transmembrane domain-containing protein [Clostridium sp.]|uniref:ferric reductase-like transmembrane domain-containing protein n=1 Tax=Clostridium sp. TaxID=1506 RepID=UPI002FCB2E90
MVLIYSLIFAFSLSLLFTTSIKKYKWVYYTLAILTALSTLVYQIGMMFFGFQIDGIIGEIEKASFKGIISACFFVVVMYAGALNVKWGITRRLLKIRTEIAIIACILLLPHGIMYLIYFVMGILSGAPITAKYLVYSLAGVIGFIIMIPLFITSFKDVRGEMKGGRWKKVQKWAYVFYGLTYVHVIVLLLGRDNIDMIKIGTYTGVFGLYLILKTIKYKRLCNK